MVLKIQIQCDATIGEHRIGEIEFKHELTVSPSGPIEPWSPGNPPEPCLKKEIKIKLIIFSFL